ncbi:MAG TPA: DUF1800 domain-containing protein, partial [Blastocatellia bacterium]
MEGDRQIIHLLNRIGYGPRPGDVERVGQMGAAKYVEQQLHPERIDDHVVEAELESFRSLNMSPSQAYAKYPAPNEIARQLGLRNLNAQAGNLAAPASNSQSQGTEKADANAQGQVADVDGKAQQDAERERIRAYYAQHGLRLPQRLLMELQGQKLIRAVDSQRQLQEVMADFWFNHFNIYWDKGFDRWMTTDFEMNAIRPHTLGKFRDLLLATAKSPAMLFYLDNYLSSTPNPMPARPAMAYGPFYRPPFMIPPPSAQNKQGRKPGINENYARELMELHTMGVDGGYTQKDVQEVARCFTGWTIERPRDEARFLFRPRIHDDGQKVVLGTVIPPGGGERDGEIVIDILARHPSTAKFISTALVRRFVSDDPPGPLVDRITQVYMRTDGDIRQMMRAILFSPEFNSTTAYRAKIKSPFELTA